MIEIFKRQETVQVSAEPDESVMAQIEDDARRLGAKLVEASGRAEAIAHHFGDLCRLITDLAMAQGEDLLVLEYQILNKCLDAGIAGAIDGYNLDRARDIEDLNEEHGHFLHELRNLLCAAHLAYTLIQSGKVGHNGSTGKVLSRSLNSMRELLDRSLTKFKEGQGNVPAAHSPIRLSEFVDEMSTTVSTVYPGKTFCLASRFAAGTVILANKESLLSALFNLIQNAFKFTCPGTAVRLTVETSDDLLRFAVADHCGGIPDSALKSIFSSYVQGGSDKSGLGLGLTAVRRCVEEHGGVLRLENLPGHGCVFFAELPIVAQYREAHDGKTDAEGPAESRERD